MIPMSFAYRIAELISVLRKDSRCAFSPRGAEPDSIANGQALNLDSGNPEVRACCGDISNLIDMEPRNVEPRFVKHGRRKDMRVENRSRGIGRLERQIRDRPALRAEITTEIIQPGQEGANSDRVSGVRREIKTQI